MSFQGRYKKFALALTASVGILLQSIPLVCAADAVALGVVNPVPNPAVGRIHPTRRVSRKANLNSRRSSKVSRTSSRKSSNGKKGKQAKAAAPKLPPRPPQDAIDRLSKQTLAPGVVHMCHRGPLNINILDVDLNEPGLEVKPVLAGDAFNRLDEVRDQAQRVNAIAAVNANYFKKDGTPLGTLVIDGEWVAGPLYDRISFGLTEDGRVHVDRANLHGTVESSNPDIGTLWVNNINQPRRSGAKLIAYTRRWGSSVKMAYAGCLVAVDSTGRVVDKTTQFIGIPYGGFVLSDTKYGAINKLKRGDLVFLEWHHRPDTWSDVIQAVSGGPGLIRRGKLYVDLKDEHFRKTWTSNSIHARTALGVTRNHHLILCTVEGAHSLWDVAKMLQRLGCVEAMNLDGGGSTTMVVGGKIVTRNKNTYQRRVAVSLAVLPRKQSASIAVRKSGNYVPETEISFFAPETTLEQALPAPELADPLANDINERLAKEEPAPVEAKGLEADNLQVNEENQALEERSRNKKGKSKQNRFGWMKRFKIPGQ